MKRLLIILLFIVFNHQTNAQSRWQDYFNYTDVKEIHQIGDKLYCISSNAIFTYDLNSKEIEKISKVNFLNGVKPTASSYNADIDYFLIGYENGEIDILGEESENFIEIPLDDYTGRKEINHISTQGNLMLLSGSYGISIFDLDRREFAETTFFRKNGNHIQVNESEFFNGKIYAASNEGLYTHPNDELIPNFNNWIEENVYSLKGFQHIQKFSDKLIVSSGGSALFLDSNNSWQILDNFDYIVDLNVNDSHLIVSTQNEVYVYDESLNLVQQKNFEIPIQCGIYANGEIYAGTSNSGLIHNQEKIYPDGPFSNNAYHVTATQENIWISPGGQINYNEPQNNTEGYFHFNGIAWVHVKSKDLNNARDIIHTSVNPSNINEVYVNAWHYNYNLYLVEDDELKKEYTYQNTGSQGIVENIYNWNIPTQVTVLGGTAFDRDGNLYVTQSYLKDNHSALIKKTPSGEWSRIIFNQFYQEKSGIKEPVMGKNGFVWVANPRGEGLIVSNMVDSYRLLSTDDYGKLPSDYVYCVEIDNNGTSWIGTQSGLRIKRNPIAALESGNYDTEPVVIVQNGIAEALLTDTTINDITVDSSNRKWIATQGAGVFYVSSTGKEVISHFTEDDSPLPSNNVNAIAVDSSTGVVYFATDSGLVSYQGDAVETGDGFGEVVVYPNPVRPGYAGNITIKGLANDTEVRITDVVGNLIHKDKEAGGIIQWNQTNLKGEKVASGIYIVMLISGDGMQNKTTKVAIIR